MMPVGDLSPGYPADYRDPEWDGSEQEFAEVVIPARVDALKQTLNDALAEAGFPDLRFEWETPGERPVPGQ